VLGLELRERRRQRGNRIEIRTDGAVAQNRGRERLGVDCPERTGWTSSAVTDRLFETIMIRARI
jgi:hypothetical protein